MRKISLLIVSVLFSVFTYGQTILINPTGDGGFETGADFTANGWTTVNDATNTWNVGTVSVPSAGTNAAFVSNDLGVTNAYTNTLTQVSYFYKDITVPAGETKIVLSFKWKNSGESGSWDRPFVYTAPTTSTPVANSMTVTGSTDVTGTTNYLVLQTTYQTATYFLPAGLAGTTFRLIFGWKNDGSGGVNPPASIDEISLVSQAPSPLHGIYTIDNTLPTSVPMLHDGTGNFASFTAAATYLNSDGISGAVTFRVLTGLTFTEDVPAINATGTAANTITFQKFGAGANPILRPTGTAGTDAGITINGGDYFTFDGIDITEATGSAVEYGYFIKNASAIDGAQNNIIKNCKIILNRANTGSRGIYQNVATAATNATGANSNNKFQFVVIENSYNGIVCTGTAAFPDLSTEVSNCTIGANSANDIGNGGSTLSALRLTSSQDAMVFNNTVRNATVTGGVTLYGIFMENVRGNSQVFNNKVYNITSTSTATTALLYGIRLDVPATFQGAAYNNIIYGFSHAIATASATMVCRPLAVNMTGTGSVALSYNTVNVGLNGNATVAAAYINGGTVVLANNIFANFSVSGNATSKRYCIYKVAAATITSNYNDLFIAAGTNNFVGYATADQATLANWQTASTQDANSLNVDPIFVGANDLHPSNPALNNLGTPVLITLDIDGITRNATTPDMGAYEFTPASCLVPGALTATTITTNSAVLGWTPNGPETLWNIEWGTTGFVQGTGTTVNGLTSTSYNLSGLTGNTAYSFYVQADCGGSTSTWAGPFSFYTGYCTPSSVSNLSYVDNFTTTGGSLNISNLASGFATGGYFNGTAQVVQGYANSTFNFNASIIGGTVGFSIWVDWNKDLVFDNTTEKVFNTTSYGNGPFTGIITIPVGTALGNYTMRIVTDYNSSNPSLPCASLSRGEFEDYTITVTTPPACVAPTALTATGVTANSATLSWTAGGTEVLWNIELGVLGFTPTGTPTTSGVTNPYSVSSLLANTSYSYYVQADCGGSTSIWAGPFTFFTGYCTPAPSSVDGIGITNVTCGTINNTTVAETGNYGDYSAMVANIAQLTTVTVNITYATGYTYDTKIWIDWNDDLDFLDLGEEVYTGTSLASNPTTLVATFVVPGTATLGNHRMRIGGLDAGPATPCYTGSWGCFEDYTVNVTVPPACIAPTALNATSITNSAATLGWTAGSTELLWNIEWGTLGFTQGTGTLVSGLTANSYSLTSLTSNTSYSFYVQADCGGSTSTWVGPFTFVTPCDNVNIFPYIESFDGATYAPMCWSNPSTSPWDRQTTGVYPTCTPHSGAAMSSYNCYNYSTGTTGILVTPGLDLPSDLYEVRFWMYRDNGYPTNADLVNVYYNTLPNTTGATLLGTINRSNTLSPVEATANQWYEYAFNMPAGSTGNGRYVIFEAVSAYGNNIFVDDVKIGLQLSSANNILTFDIPSQTTSTVGVNTVNILMPCATNITALTPTITVSPGATISPASGVAQDFTNPVTYTVTAENGTSTSTWQVSVISNPLPTIALTSPSAVSICNGGNTDITLALTGTGPWTWVGDDGSGPATFNAAASPFTTNVAPTVSTTYSIISVTDA
ncbi:MAG: fibronectin type III domain-containing protein, partial [Bacteroidia bacterium]|nr:fibronectin type III domain-containing protein [Bacteroidia bacterium]